MAEREARLKLIKRFAGKALHWASRRRPPVPSIPQKRKDQPPTREERLDAYLRSRDL
jgi:hypothetical protein